MVTKAEDEAEFAPTGWAGVRDDVTEAKRIGNGHRVGIGELLRQYYRSIAADPAHLDSSPSYTV